MTIGWWPQIPAVLPSSCQAVDWSVSWVFAVSVSQRYYVMLHSLVVEVLGMTAFYIFLRNLTIIILLSIRLLIITHEVKLLTLHFQLTQSIATYFLFIHCNLLLRNDCILFSRSECFPFSDIHLKLNITISYILNDHHSLGNDSALNSYRDFKIKIIFFY